MGEEQGPRRERFFFFFSLDPNLHHIPRHCYSILEYVKLIITLKQ